MVLVKVKNAKKSLAKEIKKAAKEYPKAKVKIVEKKDKKDKKDKKEKAKKSEKKSKKK